MNKRILIALSVLSSLLLMPCVHAAEAPASPPAAAQQAPAAKAADTWQDREKRGDEYMAQGNLPAALKEFDAAIERAPKEKTLYVKKGIALYGSRQPHEAIALMDQAIELNKDDKKWAWWPLYHKAIAQARTGDMGSAVQSLDASIKLDSNFENRLARAMAYSNQQQPAKALEDIRVAIRFKPDDKRLGPWAADLEEQVKAMQYAEDVAREKGAQKTASGLVYFELKKGSGKNPAPTDQVKVHYHGTLPDGTVFDSSVQRKEPATFPLNGVIPCWTEGLQKMQVGGKAKLVCPAKIAYGSQGAPPTIKPGATLVFEVELLAIE